MRLTTVRNVYDAVPVEHELIISVGVNTFKTKGILVFSRRGYLSTLGPRTFIIFMLFLTLEHKRRNYLLLLSRNRPILPTSSNQFTNACNYNQSWIMVSQQAREQQEWIGELRLWMCDESRARVHGQRLMLGLKLGEGCKTSSEFFRQIYPSLGVR